MTEKEIKELITGHEERNRELLRTLRSRGVAIDVARAVEHHFWSNSQREAAMLAKELYNRGYLLLGIGPVQVEDGSELWNVEAELKQKPSEAAGHRVSEDLTRLAAGFGSTYDGWGTIA